jgi:hypothetical protein
MKQQTIRVGFHKITMKTRVKTHLGNFNGYGIRITDNLGNDENYHIMKLEEREAKDQAFVRFVMAHGISDEMDKGWGMYTTIGNFKVAAMLTACAKKANTGKDLIDLIMEGIEKLGEQPGTAEIEDTVVRDKITAWAHKECRKQKFAPFTGRF